MDNEFHYLALTCRELETLLFAILTEAGKMAVESVKAGGNVAKQKVIKEKIDTLKVLCDKISDEIFVKHK